MYVPESCSLMIQSPKVQRILSIAGIAGWIHRHQYLVTRDERFSIKAESGELPRIIHLQCPGLADFYPFSRLPVGDADYLHKNERMRIDELEVLHLHYGDEAFLSVVDASDGVVPLRGDAPGQDNSSSS